MPNTSRNLTHLNQHTQIHTHDDVVAADSLRPGRHNDVRLGFTDIFGWFSLSKYVCTVHTNTTHHPHTDREDGYACNIFTTIRIMLYTQTRARAHTHTNTHTNPHESGAILTRRCQLNV